MRQQLSSAGEDGASTVSTSAGFPRLLVHVVHGDPHPVQPLRIIDGHSGDLPGGANGGRFRLSCRPLRSSGRGPKPGSSRCSETTAKRATQSSSGPALIPMAVTVQVIADHPTFLPPRTGRADRHRPHRQDDRRKAGSIYMNELIRRCKGDAGQVGGYRSSALRVPHFSFRSHCCWSTPGVSSTPSSPPPLPHERLCGPSLRRATWPTQ